MTNLRPYCSRSAAETARAAATELPQATGEQKLAFLKHTAHQLVARADEIQTENSKDLKAGEEAGLSAAMLDRLKLTPERLQSLADAVVQIGNLSEPVGEVIESNKRPNGLLVTRIRVPLGVVFFIYESRPNVTVDAAALCVKSGNAVILRGGKEAFHSNTILYRLSLIHI